MSHTESRREHLSRIVAEGLDKLATLDFHGRGIVKPIYGAARARQGGEPLTYLFSRDLAGHCEKGRAIAIATGFMIRKAGEPETDGLTGTAYLAYVLSRGLGLFPVVICEKGAAEAARASVKATGLEEYELPGGMCGNAVLGQGRFAVVPFPAQGDACSEEGQAASMETLLSLDPCAFVTIERPGKNAKGIPHTTFGAAMGDISADIDAVLEKFKATGKMTFAIGDMGNELGMGLVEDVVEEITPYGKVCSCGCGGGVAAAAKADRVMMGSISDDACYAIGAALAERLGRTDLLPEAGLIERSLKEAVSAGAVDGITAENVLSIDMVPWKAHRALIELIRELVLKSHAHDSARPQFIDTLTQLKS